MRSQPPLKRLFLPVAHRGGTGRRRCSGGYCGSWRTRTRPPSPTRWEARRSGGDPRPASLTPRRSVWR